MNRSRSPRLDDDRTLRCLFVISDGLIGRVVNLIRAALDIAVRRGAATIEICDLSMATRVWAMEQDICAFDPFSEGIPDA